MVHQFRSPSIPSSHLDIEHTSVELKQEGLEAG